MLDLRSLVEGWNRHKPYKEEKYPNETKHFGSRFLLILLTSTPIVYSTVSVFHPVAPYSAVLVFSSLARYLCSSLSFISPVAQSCLCSQAWGSRNVVRFEGCGEARQHASVESSRLALGKHFNPQKTCANTYSQPVGAIGSL